MKDLQVYVKDIEWEEQFENLPTFVSIKIPSSYLSDISKNENINYYIELYIRKNLPEEFGSPIAKFSYSDKIEYSEYLKNTKKLHQEYYKQFIDKTIFDIIKTNKINSLTDVKLLSSILKNNKYFQNVISKKMEHLGQEANDSAFIFLLRTACHEEEQNRIMTFNYFYNGDTTIVEGTKKEILDLFQIPMTNKVTTEDIWEYINIELKKLEKGHVQLYSANKRKKENTSFVSIKR